MSFRGTLALAGVLTALCLGYWWMLHAETRAHEEVIAAKRLFDFEGKDVEELTVARPSEAPSTAKREGDEWAITAPFALVANRDLWNNMAATAALMTNERPIGKGAGNPAEYGLDQPKLTVSLRAKGRAATIAFGKTTPTQDYRYAREGDGPIFLVRDSAYVDLNHPLIDLRDRAMIRTRGSAVTKFEFAPGTAPEGSPTDREPVSVVVEKRDDGRWYVTKPVAGAADQEMATNLAAMLQQMPGRDFVDAPKDLSDYRLDKPKARITAWTADGAEPQDGAVQQQHREDGERRGRST